MLAIIIGDLALLLGFAVMLLPLLVTELSRPRDALWGALLLLLGLVLVTTNDRLRGAPMLGVVIAALLVSRLGCEVSFGRWQSLSDEEKLRLGSFERWTTSFQQVGATFFHLGESLSGSIKFFFRSKSTSKTIKKKWVRPENSKRSRFQTKPKPTPMRNYKAQKNYLKNSLKRHWKDIVPRRIHNPLVEA